MNESILQLWRSELEAAREHARALVDDDEGAGDLVAHWVLTEDAVVGWIETGAVTEPDVDLEDLGEAIVVRVRRSGRPAVARVILPIPAALAVAGIAVDFREHGLEVRLVLSAR